MINFLRNLYYQKRVKVRDAAIAVDDAYAAGIRDTIKAIKRDGEMPERVSVALNHTINNMDFIAITDIIRLLGWGESTDPLIQENIARQLLSDCYTKYTTAPAEYRMNSFWTADGDIGGYAGMYWENPYQYPNFHITFIPVFSSDLSGAEFDQFDETVPNPPPKDVRQRSSRKWGSQRNEEKSKTYRLSHRTRN
jgi:hypothetical protein